MTIEAKIESILFVASKPIAMKELSRTIGVPPADAARAIEALKVKYNHPASGLWILTIEDTAQMSTNPNATEVVDAFTTIEAAGELTKPQLETLTVIAYRGPVTRPELEQIRGVNCALILRNLLVRGLVEEREAETSILPVYTLSFEALRHLGIADVSELPEYAALHAHEHIKQTLAAEPKE